MNLEVSSAAGKDQKISETAAAVFVITREGRSGVTRGPMVPRGTDRSVPNAWHEYMSSDVILLASLDQGVNGGRGMVPGLSAIDANKSLPAAVATPTNCWC
jgi:hypothetical protein